MTIFSARELERAIPQVLHAARIVVLYGDNIQTKIDLFRRIRKELSIEPDDPFRFVQIDSEVIAADPARLSDELGAISMFGGGRLIRATIASRQANDIIERALAAPKDEWVLLVDTDEFDASRIPTAKTSPEILIVGCGSEGSGDFRAFVQSEFERAGVHPQEGVLDFLIPLFGDDRAAARGEIEKLMLLAGGAGTIDVAFARNCVADGSTIVADEVAAAAFSGDLSALSATLDRLVSTGSESTAALGAASRLALNLYRAKINQWKSRPEQGITNLTSADLRAIALALQGAVLQTRSDSRNAGLLAERSLIAIGNSAKSRKR